MPELPEVEAAKRLVDSHCLGAVIVKAIVDNDNLVIHGVTPAALQEALTGKKIVSTHRKGKHLWLRLDSPPWPSFQFGMSGAIIVKGVKGPQYKSIKVSDTDEFPTKYSRVHLQLDSGVEVAFIDQRRYARVRLLDDPSKVAPISELGLDAYLELPSAKELIEAFKPKKGSVKALLLDQSFIAGIGNWVGDEVLYQSKIHPEQSASSLKEEEVTRLHAAIREVLDKAVSVDADNEQFPRSWLFHQRWGKKPGLIDGNQIQYITVGGRNSAFVPSVQKYSGPELRGAKTSVTHEEEGVDVEVNADVATGDVAADKDATAEKPGTSETPKRGRGRPPKVKPDSAGVTPGAPSNDSPGSAKKRGRPPKLKTLVKPSSEEKTDLEETEKESPSEPKRRGRPPKAKVDASKEAVNKALEEAPAKEEDEDDADAASPVTPKRRGRPPKAKPEAAEETEVTKKAKTGKDEEDAASPAGSAEPKKRGRPAKAKPETDATAAVAAVATTPKKRGRPPKLA